MAEKGLRKEVYVLPWLQPMLQHDHYGVYFIVKCMEQGPTYHISVLKYSTPDPNHRILTPQRSRFTRYYFYIRDEVLRPMARKVASCHLLPQSHSLLIARELNRCNLSFRKNANDFFAVGDVRALSRR